MSHPTTNSNLARAAGTFALLWAASACAGMEMPALGGGLLIASNNTPPPAEAAPEEEEEEYAEDDDRDRRRRRRAERDDDEDERPRARTRRSSTRTTRRTESIRVNGVEVEPERERADPKGAFGATCKRNQECESNTCFVGSGQLGYCTKMCDSWSDCPSHWDCKRAANAPQKICRQDS